MNIKDLVPILCEQQLTIEEFFALWLMFYRSKVDKHLADDMINYLRNTVGYTHSNGEVKALREETLPTLEQKGWLTKRDGAYIFTPKIDEVFIEPFAAGEEFYEAYPSFGTINGNNIPLKTGDRVATYFLYWKSINGSWAKHQQVVEDVKFGIKMELVCMNIVKFVQSMYWIEIGRMRLKQDLITIPIKSTNDQDF